MTDPIKLTRDPDDAPGGYAKVFAFLREQLLSGALKTGDRLLPERDLSALLGVGRPVLREALRALAMLGAVEIRHGVGTIVRQPDASTLGEFFTFALAQQSDAIDDVMEARIAIECQAVRLACRRATLADFERIRAALQRIEATIDDPVAGGEADFDFHNGIVQAGRSETLRSVYAAIADLVHRSHRGRRELILKVPGIRSFLIDHHHRIFEALVARDVQRSDELLRRHFEIGDEYRRKAFETPRPQG